MSKVAGRFQHLMDSSHSVNLEQTDKCSFCLLSWCSLASLSPFKHPVRLSSKQLWFDILQPHSQCLCFHGHALSVRCGDCERKMKREFQHSIPSHPLRPCPLHAIMFPQAKLQTMSPEWEDACVCMTAVIWGRGSRWTNPNVFVCKELIWKSCLTMIQNWSG